MKHYTLRRRLAFTLAAVTLVTVLSVPVSASILNSDDSETGAVSSFSKNGTVDEVFTFSAEDFRMEGNDQLALDSLIIAQLPSANVGTLAIGNQPLVVGDVIAVAALDGLRFVPLPNSAETSTFFSFTPIFSSGETGEDVQVDIYLLSEENSAPVAENLEFTTYKNVAYSGRLNAVDPDGDMIKFQLVDKPARGSVTFADDGSFEFVYTPYENKTGKDTFTFVAVDSVGNTSNEATVKIKIEKPSTKVTYADMAGHPAYNAAIRLAEEEIYIGACMDGTYYFQPDLPVSRSEFLALAMSVTSLDALEGVTTTGFYDDEAISTWAKPYISSALKSGAVCGMYSENGQIVFNGDQTITEAEASVILDRLLSVSDISADTETGMFDAVPTWASQAAANLESVSVIHADSQGIITLRDELTRADTIQMLAAALNVIDARKSSVGLFS